MARPSVLPVIRELRRYVGRTRRALALEVTQVLKRVTPIKTHHAESNWVPRLGSPYRGVDGSRAAVSYAAQEAGLEQVRSEPEESTRVANVSNNVGYVTRLNRGSSAQAPTAFVQAAVAQAKVNVRAQMGVLRRAKR